MQWINGKVAEKFPGRITIAEDLQSNNWVITNVGAGEAGFGSQWDANFVHPIRQAVITSEDDQRSLSAIRDALCIAITTMPSNGSFIANRTTKWQAAKRACRNDQRSIFSTTGCIKQTVLRADADRKRRLVRLGPVPSNTAACGN